MELALTRAMLVVGLKNELSMSYEHGLAVRDGRSLTVHLSWIGF